jgi:NADH:ubiquinone oxidoreductase subunit 4 (subunit M)
VIKPLLQIIRREDWLTGANLALLVSIPLSPYGFNFDHIVLLPSIVQIIAWSSKNELPRKYTYFIFIGLIVINLIIAKMLSIDGLEYYWFFWIPIPLLGIYLFAWKTRNAYRKATN